MTSAESGSPPIRGYEDLQVYQRGMALLRPVHEAVLRFPDYEKFGLADQMRRASKSVPTNIAEGYARRRSAKEFRAYLGISMGSASEMVVHFKIARELDYLPADESAWFIGEYDVLGRQLNRLIAKWRTIVTPTSNLQPQGDQE